MDHERLTSVTSATRRIDDIDSPLPHSSQGITVIAPIMVRTHSEGSDKAAIHETLGTLLREEQSPFIADWLAEATGTPSGKATASAVEEARDIAQQLEQVLRNGADPFAFDSPAWAPLRDRLAALSSSRAAKGSSAGDTSVYVLALKKPLFDAVHRAHDGDTKSLKEALWWVTKLVDQLAQFTVSTYQRSREDIISRQQTELLELSTPVIKLWEGILAVPMIGTLDSNRTQVVMETLLQEIVDTGSELAIIDITGVPTVDTLVAQHLLKTVTAIRLMGADCIISGIRPQIAQTIVHLGIDLQGIVTKATLADALALAMKRSGMTVTKSKA